MFSRSLAADLSGVSFLGAQARNGQDTIEDLRAKVWNDIEEGDDMYFEEDEEPKPIRQAPTSTAKAVPTKPSVSAPETYSFDRAKDAIMDMWFDAANGETFDRTITLTPMIISGRVVDDLLYITVQAYSSIENGQLGALLLHDESVLNRQDCRISLQQEYPARAVLLRNINAIPEEIRCKPKPVLASKTHSPTAILDTRSEFSASIQPSPMDSTTQTSMFDETTGPEKRRLNLSAHLMNIVPESNFRLLHFKDTRQEKLSLLEKELDESVETAVKHDSIYGELFHRKKVSSLKEELRREMEREDNAAEKRTYFVEGSLQALVKQSGKQELGLAKNFSRPRKNIEQFFPKPRNSHYNMVVSTPSGLHSSASTASVAGEGTDGAPNPYYCSDISPTIALSPSSPHSLFDVLATMHATMDGLTSSSLKALHTLSLSLLTLSLAPEAASHPSSPALTHPPVYTATRPHTRSPTTVTPEPVPVMTTTTHPSLLSSLRIRSSLDASFSSVATLAHVKSSASRAICEASIPSISCMASFKGLSHRTHRNHPSLCVQQLPLPSVSSSSFLRLVSTSVRRPSVLLLNGTGVGTVDARVLLKGLMRAVKR